MYTGTSYQCMFQPQDQIEVGEDGYKQYDGKPGFLMRLRVNVCWCVVCLLLLQGLICHLHDILG